MKTKKLFVQSGGNKIYVELGYPEKSSASAVIIAHGLRSYYTGFLNIFSKQLREAGYISVKFHFVGTGKSSGAFEEKTTKAMLQNYADVLYYVKSLPEVKRVGIVGRSNAANLATINGPDSKVKAYVFLAPPAFYSRNVARMVKSAKVVGNFFYHKSFKRPHTKGEGRLPLTFERELRQYDAPLLKNIKKMKPVIFFQSTQDETVSIKDGHFDYWKKNLPNPKKLVLIEGGNHSYKGHKRFVIKESIKWLKKYLPIK